MKRKPTIKDFPETNPYIEKKVYTTLIKNFLIINLQLECPHTHIHTHIRWYVFKFFIHLFK